MTYFDHSYVIKFSFFMWEEKNLLSNTNNIISKTVIHHHTCKTKAFGRLDWQIRWTTSIFHQSNYSLLFSWTTSGNTNLKNCHFGNITFFFLSHYNPSYSHKKEWWLHIKMMAMLGGNIVQPQCLFNYLQINNNKKIQLNKGGCLT